jgi:hypothetical protein
MSMDTIWKKIILEARDPESKRGKANDDKGT